MALPHTITWPTTWLLASPHQGDNTQLQALARNLGWPATEKQLQFRAHEKILRHLRWPTVQAVTAQGRSQLAPPGPDLILLSGRPNEAVAMWIKKHHAPHAKLVFVGSPGLSPSHYDLVITSPQYRLPRASNILHLDLPLHGITPAALKGAAAEWQPKLAHLPRPLIAVLVGGPSGPYGFSPEAANRLGREASRLAGKGSLLITTSARTGGAARKALQSVITVQHHFHAWKNGNAQNPLLAYLALASDIIVTADSVSMMAEAAATGKPVHLFDTEIGKRAMQWPGTYPHWQGANLEATMFRIAMRTLPSKATRDIRIVQRNLVNSGEAQWLGGKPVTPCRTDASADRLQQSLLRIRALFGL